MPYVNNRVFRFVWNTIFDQWIFYKGLPFTFALFWQLEATQKGLQPVQNDILALIALGIQLPEANKEAARNVLAEFKKADVAMRERLFVLQVWRRYDQDTADKLARRKAGEFLDPELSKVLEERERKHDREKRERERDKERFRNQPNRFRGGAANYGDFASTPND